MDFIGCWKDLEIGDRFDIVYYDSIVIVCFVDVDNKCCMNESDEKCDFFFMVELKGFMLEGKLFVCVF